MFSSPELELLMEELETSPMSSPEHLCFPIIGTSHGELCVVDQCVEITRFIPQG